MSLSRLHLPYSGAGEVAVDDAAGTRFTSLRVLKLRRGEARALRADDGRERAFIPLTAPEVLVTVDGQPFRLAGRASVFDRVADFAYAPAGAEVTVSAPGGGEVAVAGARPLGPCPAPYSVAAADVPVEVRGAGFATRQVTNYLTPDTSPASILCVVEVLTPPANWSSYPPHKHDEAGPHEAVLEELYYFRIEGPSGFGFHRTYTADGAIDATVAVRDGDVFIVPRGYHGPCAAAPDHAMYYLNVLGGPGPERSMAFCDDPAHHWVRATWEGMAVDPRCPMTGAAGRVVSG
jgi:5-deoxy-glucuronate isomerase